jgi:hypothetical protein
MGERYFWLGRLSEMSKLNQFFAVYGYVVTTKDASDNGKEFEIKFKIWGRTKDGKDEEWSKTNLNGNEGTT